MLIGMLKKHIFNLCINDMAVFDRIKLLCLKKYLLYTLSRSRLVQIRQNRSSLLQMFFKRDVLKNFANFTGKHQCWCLVCNFITNRCFPVKFANFLRTPVFTEHLRWLLLNKPRRSLWFIWQRHVWSFSLVYIGCLISC